MPVHERLNPLRPQRGAVLLLMLVIVAISTAGYFLVKQLNSNNINIDREKITSNALAQAKIALIGWSAARGDAGNPRPGELPCPDTSVPGAVGNGVAPSSCTAGKIGRLPWKTLGIPELRDGDGEPLWYAIDGAFRTRTNNNLPINSDTRASMQVYASDGITLLTPPGSEAAAIIFAPGRVLGNQLRTTGLQKITPANYLDNTAPPVIPIARNNATANGPFVMGPIQDGSGNIFVNDRLVLLTTADLMTVVEKRVAAELKSMLQNYFLTNGYFPYPAKYDNANCTDVGATAYFTPCTSNPTLCRGRVPDDALPTAWTLPGWFSYNLWGQVIYYGVGSNFLASVPANCSPTLTLNSTGGIHGLFIMAGTPLGAIMRNTGGQSTNLADYLEDTVNQVGWAGLSPIADQYCTPGSAACLPAPATKTNDSLYTLH